MHIAVSVFLGAFAALWAWDRVQQRRIATQAKAYYARREELLSTKPIDEPFAPKKPTADTPFALLVCGGVAFCAICVAILLVSAG